MTTNQKAEYAMLKVQERALDLGAVVSRPLIEGCRYDAIVDQGGHLYRAQVKWADGKVGQGRGSVSVSLRSQSRSPNRPELFAGYTKDEIDVLLVYVPMIDRVLWLGPAIFDGRKHLAIRVEGSKNGQSLRCVFASQYLW